MKKIYKTPALREINLATEGMIAASDEKSIEMDDNFNTNEDNLLTDKKNLWDREGIWK